MGSDVFDTAHWVRTADGAIVLRLIEEWQAGVTDHGDIALSFTSTVGNDPAADGEYQRAQFLCTREDAAAIARMILRTLDRSDPAGAPGFAAFQRKIQSPALRRLAEDWDAARGSRRMPSWDDIKPDPAAPYLGGIWAYDYHQGSGVFTARLAGSAIAVGYGRNYHGKSLAELYAPPVAEGVRAHLMRVISQPACALYSGKLFKTGDTIVEGERLILPMGADPEHPDGVLGASHYPSFPLSFAPEEVEFLSDTADWCKL